ncbi:outer dynein arm-docking complex subunit 1 [Chelonia mydas]|uniref:outer dynein arm-docking complex subunit 1 n=1 Tax=Chelonia mydas TaxID=8469 RepID=UPI0018A20F68|nr:outer dynein arm-docking complex subunit 1 [Chelonia mydas]XP_043390590.1 outer dynein arm-docking complex subunit 1 [Chelonia mydas]
MPLHRSASSTRSEGSDLDLEGIAESELAKLQRQFRLLAGDRHAYTLQSQETIRKQLADLQRLEKEREGLLRELRVAEGRANRQREQEKAGSLRALLRHQDQVEEQAATERRTVAQLDHEIRSWEKRLAGLAKQVGSAGVSQRHKAQGQRRVRTLENQLDKASARFNSQLALNAGLREELETLRIERGRFEHLYRRLERELQETRKAIGAVIDSSSSAFDARDEAQTKLGQLREKAEKDLAQYGAEMKELQRVLDHDRRLRHFLDIKVQERTFTQEALEAKRKREQEEAEGKHRDPREELLESYETAFKEIQQLTGEDDLDVLVEKFIAVEDRNFAQFNYVNEQNNELERLGERITQVRREIQEAQAQEQQEQQEQWAQTRALEMQQEAVVQEAQELLSKEKVVRKTLEQLKEGIRSLFRKLDCQCSELDLALGGSAVVQDRNISVFLGLLEQRAHELLAMRSYLASKNYDLPYHPEETARLLLGQMVGYAPKAYPLRPPTAGEEYEAGSEEEERPLTHSELRDRILREVLSKEETPSHK